MASKVALGANFGASESDVQQNVARLSIWANVLLVVIKIGAGVASHSLSVLAEGIQSLLDIFASTLILYAVRAAAAPPDRAHPWGHGKFENITALLQMTLMLGSVGGIWWASWARWMHPSMPHVDIGLIALAVSAGVNIAVGARVARVARDTRSMALHGEVVHLRGDLWAVCGVMVGLLATHAFNEPRFDPFFAAVMTVFSLHSALILIRDTLRPLLDERLPFEEEAQIRAALDGDARVLGFHRLRTRQAGSHRYADVHVMLSDELTFREAHAVSEDIEDALRAALPNMDVIVHAEPFEEESLHQREVHGDDAF